MIMWISCEISMTATWANLQMALQALGPTRPTPELKQSSYDRQISDTGTPRESVDGHDTSNPFNRSSKGTEEWLFQNDGSN